jgi:phosphoribosylformylglycinamidine synthase PurS subunit
VKFIAHINVMPHKALLDPQGRAVSLSMKNIALEQVSNVRIGKHMTIEIEAAGEIEAREIAETACKKLLANPIMEFYEIELSQA